MKPASPSAERGSVEPSAEAKELAVRQAQHRKATELQDALKPYEPDLLAKEKYTKLYNLASNFAASLAFRYGEIAALEAALDIAVARLESAASPPPAPRADEIMQDDIALLLRTLGISDHARSASPHEVMVSEIIPAVARLAQNWAPLYAGAAPTPEAK